MSHAHDHPHESSADLIAHAERVCAERKLQLTPLRRRVFAALAASDVPLGAYDLVERLGAERRIAPISVYRVLDFLIEARLIHRIALKNSYVPCHHAHDGHEAMLFLVCRICGQVEEVSSVDVARGIGGTAAAAGFRIGLQPVEIEGECQSCQIGAPV